MTTAFSQGDRRAELRISGYRVAGEERQLVVLPAALGVTILDDDLPAVQRLLGVGTGAGCALLNGGSVRCWHGANAAAELRPALASAAIRTARQLAFGEQHVCWLQQDGWVACAGNGSRGQLDVPADLAAAVSVAAGREHSCAVDADGAVRCWGRDSDGQSSPPADLGQVLQLSLGESHSCALRGDDSVRCWGYDGEGQASPPGNLGPAVQLALGYDHSCALRQDGQVRCWGYDGHTQSQPPKDLGPVVQLASGDNTAVCCSGTDGCAVGVRTLQVSWQFHRCRPAEWWRSLPAGTAAACCWQRAACAAGAADRRAVCHWNCSRAISLCRCGRRVCSRGSRLRFALPRWEVSVKCPMCGSNCWTARRSSASITGCWTRRVGP